ncbi:MAG: ribbon-helix-helix domain-containing protein [Dehalococcoidia bacterium]
MSIAQGTKGAAPAGPAWHRVPRNRSGATTRTTLALDVDLLAAVDAEVLRGAARGRSEFINAAVLAELKRRESQAVDVAFRSMADDVVYLAEMRQIDAEFASADAETSHEIGPDPGLSSE